MSNDHIIHMTQAIRLARLGLYTTRPNPRVGCVLVKNATVIAEGWHQYAGGPHAERVALAIAGVQAKGATAYVSLEPCCHYGRTPPCTDALISAEIAHVVVAMQDPNPEVTGKGIAQLRAAGIQVDVGVLESQALALNPGFIKRMRQCLPWVSVKMAMSLDGRTAPASGKQQWITGAPARRDVQLLRARADAIITGIGTVLADDPALTVRLPAKELPGMAADAGVQQPLRVVLDTHLRMPTTAKMLGMPGHTLILHASIDAQSSANLAATGASVQRIATTNGLIDIDAVLSLLATNYAVNEVLVEAGPTLAGAFVDTGLVDELIIYLAPQLLGDSAKGLLHLPLLSGGEQPVQLEITEMVALGQDWRIRARIKELL